MKRQYYTFPIESVPIFKLKLFNWIARYNISVFLDNHQYPSLYSDYECIAAAGCLTRVELKDGIFSSLSSFVSDNDDWIFGHLSYDVKNQIEELQSFNIDNIKFPKASFLYPKSFFLLATQNSRLVQHTVEVMISSVRSSFIRCLILNLPEYG